MSRKTVRVVFHLVDAQHGPIDEGMCIMGEVGESLPKKKHHTLLS
jgi:hypothetical protein